MGSPCYYGSMPRSASRKRRGSGCSQPRDPSSRLTRLKQEACPPSRCSFVHGHLHLPCPLRAPSYHLQDSGWAPGCSRYPLGSQWHHPPNRKHHHHHEERRRSPSSYCQNTFTSVSTMHAFLSYIRLNVELLYSSYIFSQVTHGISSRKVTFSTSRHENKL